MSTPDPVEGTDRLGEGILCQMDIDRGGVNGFMPKKRLDREKVNAVLVKVCAKGMAEGMAGDTGFPPEAQLLFMDMPGKIKSVNGFVGMELLREKPAPGFSVGIPILGQDIKSVLRKDSKAVRAVLAMGDMDTHMGAADIVIAQMADFPNAQAGGIQKGCHGFLFEIGHGIDEGADLLPGRDIGEILIELAHGELGVIPWFMEDIKGKETQLGDGAIDGTVR